MNVMARIKKSKKTKSVQDTLERKAAQFMAKQKQAGEKTHVVLEEYLKTDDPFKEILQYPESYWYELLLTYIENLPNENVKKKIQVLPSTRIEQIKVFNFLLYNLPFTEMKKFIRSVVSKKISNQKFLPQFLNYFESFIRQSETVNKINSMKKFLKSREAEPEKYRSPLPIPPPLKRQPVLPQPVVPQLQGRNLPVFGKGEILSICEREYGNAPWMQSFTNESIRGILIYTNTRNEYTSSYYINGWYKVNMLWIKHACEHKVGTQDPTRKFPIAYLTHTGKIIPETPEMYAASKPRVQNINIKDEPISVLSFDVAKSMLKNSMIQSNDVDAVLNSLDTFSPSSTNRDIAKRLSWVLVFLEKLISEPQIHHYRVKTQQYLPEILVELDRFALLPEVYKNPDIDQNEINNFENILNRKRQYIEEQFYDRYERLKDPEKRKKNIQARIDFKPLKTNVYEKCPPGTADVVFYQDEKSLFCFERQTIINTKYNPITGKEWSPDFILESRRLKDPTTQTLPQKPQQQTSIVLEKELAPGLIRKLKDQLKLLETYTCTNCKEEILHPIYKSVKNQTRVLFCGEECFENYKF